VSRCRGKVVEGEVMTRGDGKKWVVKVGDEYFELMTVDDLGAKATALSFTRSSRDEAAEVVEGEGGG
jgi:hypothetical protein